jgi:hypothetical protein
MSGIAAVIAARKSRERDAADPLGAVSRNRTRALASALLTTFWAGAALLVVTTVAPAAFSVLPTRALAGALVGRILPVLFIAGAVVATVSFILARTAAEHVAVRRIGAAGMLAGCFVAQGVIAPKISALRERIGPSIEALPVDDPLRTQFGQLHGMSVLALGVAMIFALVVVIGSLAALRERVATEPTTR